MSLVKANIEDKNADELVQFSNAVELAMTGNAHFANPVPTLLEVKAARQALEAAIPPALNGDRVAVALRNTLAAALGSALVRLCGYVNSASEGDRDIALTSSFPAAKTNAPLPLVAPPTKVLASSTKKQGEVRVTFKCSRGSRTRQVYMNSGDPNVESSWALVGVTTKNNYLVTGLDPTKFYWFRVNAVCTAGVSGYSDPAIGRTAA